MPELGSDIAAQYVSVVFVLGGYMLKILTVLLGRPFCRTFALSDRARKWKDWRFVSQRFVKQCPGEDAMEARHFPLYHETSLLLRFNGHPSAFVGGWRPLKGGSTITL